MQHKKYMINFDCCKFLHVKESQTKHWPIEDHYIMQVPSSIIDNHNLAFTQPSHNRTRTINLYKKLSSHIAVSPGQPIRNRVSVQSKKGWRRERDCIYHRDDYLGENHLDWQSPIIYQPLVVTTQQSWSHNKKGAPYNQSFRAPD